MRLFVLTPSLLVGALGACAGPVSQPVIAPSAGSASSPASAPSPLAAVSKSAAEVSAKADEMGMTGVLSEEAFAALHALRTDGAPSPRGQAVALSDGSAAYLSLPAGDGPHPAVIVIHEWWGLNDHIRHWADRLAADGYAALAVDLYGGRVATAREDALAYMKSVDQTKGRATLVAARDFLRTDQRVRAASIGSIGWCFGGGWSLQAALTMSDLDAAVIYYGRLVTDPDALSKIEAKVLGVFGNLDRGIPPSAVDAFEKAMTEAGRDLKVLRYDANHAFANPSSARYDKAAATEAFTEVRAFLAAHLK